MDRWEEEFEKHKEHLLDECDGFKAAWDIQQKRAEKLVEALKFYEGFEMIGNWQIYASRAKQALAEWEGGK